jgi:hypothetical protein
VIVVFVMDGEFAQLFPAKLAPAPGTDPGVHLEGFFPVGLLPLRSVSQGIGDNATLLFVV